MSANPEVTRSSLNGNKRLCFPNDRFRCLRPGRHLEADL